MAVFAVHLSGDQPAEQAKTLENTFAKRYKVSERFYLVHFSGISKTVSENLKLGSEHGGGAVFKLNASYFGWESRAMWEWLESAESD